MRVDAFEGAGGIKGTLGLVRTPGAQPALGVPPWASGPAWAGGCEASAGHSLRSRPSLSLAGASRWPLREPGCQPRRVPVGPSGKASDGPCQTVKIHTESLPPGLLSSTHQCENTDRRARCAPAQARAAP